MVYTSGALAYFFYCWLLPRLLKFLFIRQQEGWYQL